MKKSIEFYKDVLGLPLKYQSEEWTEFFNDGTALALRAAKEREKIKSAPTILTGFMINDMDITVRQLKEKKVKFFKEPREEPFGKHAIFEDPDEHLISIVQLEAKSAEGFDLLGLIGAE
jgi:catechol 2,3-dioxygenase-like lactoylglutathione lyase family enzyme